MLEKIACGTWTWCKSDLVYRFIIKSFHLFFSAKCYANDPRSVRSFRLNQFSTTVAGISTSKSAIGPVDACQTMSYIALVWFTMDWFRSSSDQISHSEHQFMDCLRAVRSDVITEVRPLRICWTAMFCSVWASGIAYVKANFKAQALSVQHVSKEYPFQNCKMNSSQDS